MIQVPASLQAEIDKLRGRKLQARVTINYSSAYGDDAVFASSSGTAPGGRIEQAYNGREDTTRKFAQADGLALADGTWFPVPTTPVAIANNEIGWWGDDYPLASREYAAYSQPLLGEHLLGESIMGPSKGYPYLELLFLPRTIINIRLSFDTSRNEYPVDFDVVFFDAAGEELYKQEVRGSTGVRYIRTIGPLTLCARMKVIFYKWNVRSTPKVAEMLSSLQEVYLGSDLFDLQIVEGLGRESMSGSQCVVTLYNRFRKFDSDNINSILFNQLRPGVRIFPEIGDGTTWIPLGEFYAAEWDISRRDLRATVTGFDKLWLMEKSEYRESKIIDKPADQQIYLEGPDFLAGTYVGLVVSDGLRLL